MISCTVQGAAGEARPGAVLHPARPRLLRPGQHPQAAASLTRNINIYILLSALWKIASKKPEKLNIFIMTKCN